MQLFYTPDIRIGQDHFLLSEEESKHAIRVLRLEIGSAGHLVDGRGNLFSAEIVDAHPKRTLFHISKVIERYGESTYHLHIAIAPTKNMDRLEWFVEKATEIGVQQITPIICDRSERKDVKRERLEKVAITAMKQSLKAYLPQINEGVSFSNFLKTVADADVPKLIAHCGEGQKAYIGELLKPKGNYLIMIGPEGDFSTAEISLAQNEGMKPLSLGESRLRTETAALLACAEVHLLNR